MSFPLTIVSLSKDAEVVPSVELGVGQVDARWADAAVVAFASDYEAGQQDC